MNSSIYSNFKDGPTRFFLDPLDLEKWLHQNKAVYTGDYLEGCLQDNFVVATKRGYAAIYEHYLNCWSSDYRVVFQAGAAQDMWREWYEFEERYIAEYGETA